MRAPKISRALWILVLCGSVAALPGVTPAGASPPAFSPPTIAPAGFIPGAAQEAFDAYWAARSPEEASAAADRIVAAGTAFDDVWRQLRAGPAFRRDAEKGRLVRERRNSDGMTYPYLVYVPQSYDASRAYAVRVYLHGGVARPKRDETTGWWRNPERVIDDEHIAIFPYSWNESLWWQASQVENLGGILWELKRGYNIDENRVHMIGTSDGGTGAWFYAFRDTTPWAGFLPFIAHPAVLSSPRVGADGEIFVINLRNKAYYVVNGSRDRLYPVAAVEPFVDLFRQAGVELTFVPKYEEGHSTRWWPDEASKIEGFIASTPRRPYPDQLWWRTERTDRYNRAHWLVIDELGPVHGESELGQFNRLQVGGRVYDAFRRDGPSGRVDLEREGNEVRVRTEGVRRYRLLLSPDQFDFERPMRVITNGVESFDGRVEPDVSTLLEWAVRDNDRTMLFGAELEIVVGAESREGSR